MSEVIADPGRRRARARERLRRFRSGKRRIDFYPDEDSAEVIAALLSPGDCTSAVINWVIAEWAAGRALQAAGPNAGG